MALYREPMKTSKSYMCTSNCINLPYLWRFNGRSSFCAVNKKGTRWPMLTCMCVCVCVTLSHCRLARGLTKQVTQLLLVFVMHYAVRHCGNSRCDVKSALDRRTGGEIRGSSFNLSTAAAVATKVVVVYLRREIDACSACGSFPPFPAASRIVLDIYYSSPVLPVFVTGRKRITLRSRERSTRICTTRSIDHVLCR